MIRPEASAFATSLSTSDEVLLVKWPSVLVFARATCLLVNVAGKLELEAEDESELEDEWVLLTAPAEMLAALAWDAEADLGRVAAAAAAGGESRRAILSMPDPCRSWS